MTQSDHGRHRGAPRPNSTQRRLAVALLVVAVIGSAAATAWAVTATTRDGSGSRAGVHVTRSARVPDTKTGTPNGTGRPTPEETPEETPVDAVNTATAETPPPELATCEATVASADAAVEAAERGVTHWSEHVQARTDLLAGKIALDQTNAIFKRTRLAGPKDLEIFDAANKKYEAERSGCKDLDPNAVPHTWRDTATACVERRTVAARGVDAAAAAIDDWRSHQANMRAHRDGEMTSAMAQQQWIAAWKAAPPNINAYADAIKQLADAPTCAL